MNEINIKEFEFKNYNEWAIVENYPYGFMGKCTYKIMVESNPKGERVKTQTIFKGRENKPKLSTYGHTDTIILIKDNKFYNLYVGKEKSNLYFNNELLKTFKEEENTNLFNLIPEATQEAIKEKWNYEEKINKVFEVIEKKTDENRTKLNQLSDEEKLKDWCGWLNSEIVSISRGDNIQITIQDAENYTQTQIL